jgi:energy-coupling factor transporter ATP-binding protein EcfA2
VNVVRPPFSAASCATLSHGQKQWLEIGMLLMQDRQLLLVDEPVALNQFYGGSHTLWDIDMEVPKGSCTCLMGRNGMGKTTLLKCIIRASRRERPTHPRQGTPGGVGQDRGSDGRSCANSFDGLSTDMSAPPTLPIACRHSIGFDSRLRGDFDFCCAEFPNSTSAIPPSAAFL